MGRLSWTGEWSTKQWVGVGLIAMAGVVLASVGLGHLFAGGNGQVTDWVQALGATISIFLAVWIALWQHSRAERAQRDADAAAEQAAHKAEKTSAEAAYSMVYEVLEIVGDRLNVALGKSTAEYGLRALRTTEMVEAMREFDTRRVPIAILTDFVKIRSRAYAINARVTELYRREDRSKGAARRAYEDKRNDKLASAVATHGWAMNAVRRLEATIVDQWEISAVPFTPRPNIESYVPPPRLTGPSGQ